MTEPKVSFIVPCRNKAHFIEKTAKSVLAQTYSPMEIILSDQGSTDDTLAILKILADEYKGPNTVRVLECPDTELRGMAGLNAHLNWLHTQMTGDLVIMCSADDLNHPDRAKYTVEAWQKYNPSYIGTCVQYLTGKGENKGFTAPARDEGWVDPVENIVNLVGSSASSCWARDLFEKYGPMRGIESQDMLLPFFGTLERGLFYINVPLHIYIEHADENNTGLGGVCRAATLKRENATNDEELMKALEEEGAATDCNNWHFTSNYFAMYRRVQEMNINILPELGQAVLQKALDGAAGWCLARDNITLARVQPKLMRI